MFISFLILVILLRFIVWTLENIEFNRYEPKINKNIQISNNLCN
jgi:hypothetical protein